MSAERKATGNASNPQFLSEKIDKGLSELRRRLTFGTHEERVKQLDEVQRLNWELGVVLKRDEEEKTA